MTPPPPPPPPPPTTTTTTTTVAQGSRRIYGCDTTDERRDEGVEGCTEARSGFLSVHWSHAKGCEYYYYHHYQEEE